MATSEIAAGQHHDAKPGRLGTRETRAPGGPGHGHRAPALTERLPRERLPLDTNAEASMGLRKLRIGYVLLAPVLLVAGIPPKLIAIAGLLLCTVSCFSAALGHYQALSETLARQER